MKKYILFSAVISFNIFNKHAVSAREQLGLLWKGRLFTAVNNVILWEQIK